MKTFVRLLITSFVLTPSVALATTLSVSAQSPVVSAVLGESTTNTVTDSSSKVPETENADDKTLLDRLAARKTELKLKLTTIEQAKLKAKCKVAQTGPVTTLATRLATIGTDRTKAYNDVIDRLNSLDTKIKAKNIDTTTLESEIATLKTKVTTFQTDLATYKQAVVDLKSLDCQTDPTAFKAALETARTDRDQVAKDSLDIRSYIENTIKPTLKDLRTKVQANSSASSSTGGNQ